MAEGAGAGAGGVRGLSGPRVAVAGAVNWDSLIVAKGFPSPGSEARAIKVLEFPGGKGANAAVAASRILGGWSSGLIGAVGDDDVGRRQLEGLRERRVDARGVLVIEGESSGRAFVIVDESSGENEIISYHGALLRLSREHARSGAVLELVEGAEVVVVMDVPPGFMEELALEAARAGRTVVLAPGLKAVEEPQLVRSIASSGADYLVLNEHEARGLAGLGREPAEEAARRLAGLGPRVIVTLGGGGALMAGGGEELRVPGVDLRRVGMRPVNTVGCGDAFIGAFAALKAMGREDGDALRLANLAGAFKATRLEVQGSPTLEELEEFESALGVGGA